MSSLRKMLSLLLVLAVLSDVVVAFSAEFKGQEPSGKKPSELTAEELKAIYKKYNISENDLKFALRELPHYLEGYLPESYVVMGRIGANGTVENWVDPKAAENFKKLRIRVLNASEFFEIREKARKAYIEKYGVDPRNPKVVLMDGIPLPKEYVKELAKKHTVKYSDGGITKDFKLQYDTRGSKAATGPQIKNGALYLWIVEAGGDERPTNDDYFDATLDAYNRFKVFNSGANLRWYFLNFWDASDVTTGKLSDYLDDLAEDVGSWRSWYNDGDPQNDIMIGWIKSADDKYCGYAYINGFYSVGVSESGHYACWVIPLDIVAQHEISHNFNAIDSRYCWEHDPCIMNYCWVTPGAKTWCNSCRERVNVNINGIGDE